MDIVLTSVPDMLIEFRHNNRFPITHFKRDLMFITDDFVEISDIIAKRKT